MIGVIVLVIWLCFATIRDNAAVVFLVLVILQAVGMITDGLDGWYARKFGGGGTPEGQFLDQFIDKVFVWGIWIFSSIALAIHGQVELFQLPWVLVWGTLSLWLVYRDTMSCKKHLANYLLDRDKPFNKKSGAISWGKRKFLFENIALCVILLALAPLEQVGIIPVLGPFLTWVIAHTIELALSMLLVAIICSEISIRKRGVVKTRGQKLEAKYRPPGFAEAVVDPDERL